MNWLRSTRSLHHVAKAKNYPKVNVADVDLTKTRIGFRKEREPLLSQLVTSTIFPSVEIRQRYRDAGKPVPIKFRLRSDEISRRNWERTQDEIAQGLPHFRVGEKKVYFPKARICLLRPNAKHTPYQAKFLVPRNFNKIDLRDYLWNVYGLRALNITVQLLHARWRRAENDYARYRGPQYKKMTIDMAEPFVWPEIDAELVQQINEEADGTLDALMEKNRQGSNKLEPKKAYDGLYAEKVLPNLFVPKHKQAGLAEKVKQHNDKVGGQSDREMVEKMLNL